MRQRKEEFSETKRKGDINLYKLIGKDRQGQAVRQRKEGFSETKRKGDRKYIEARDS